MLATRMGSSGPAVYYEKWDRNVAFLRRIV